MSKAVRSALDILFAVAESTEDEVTLTIIADRLGMPKANVLRALVDLEARGLVVRDAARSVQLGFSVLALANAFHAKVPLAQRSLAHLRRLCAETGETAALQIAIGQERACIQQIESPADVKWAVPIGRRFPIASGAAGKILMAFMGTAERDAILNAPDYKLLADEAVPNVAAFRKSLEEVRQCGFALSENETRPGASGVAAPVWDQTGIVVAAMTVAGPSHRIPKSRFPILAEATMQAAKALSLDLGWRMAPIEPAKRGAKLKPKLAAA